jgi:hypothetical protein
VSPPVKLCAFALLLVAIFLAARAAGASLGPVTTIDSRDGGTPAHSGPGMPGMNMFPSSPGSRGASPAPAASATPPGERKTR